MTPKTFLVTSLHLHRKLLRIEEDSMCCWPICLALTLTNTDAQQHIHTLRHKSGNLINMVIKYQLLEAEGTRSWITHEAHVCPKITTERFPSSAGPTSSLRRVIAAPELFLSSDVFDSTASPCLSKISLPLSSLTWKEREKKKEEEECQRRRHHWEQETALFFLLSL